MRFVIRYVYNNIPLAYNKLYVRVYGNVTSFGALGEKKHPHEKMKTQNSIQKWK